jgi:hypothetical protein
MLLGAECGGRYAHLPEHTLQNLLKASWIRAREGLRDLSGDATEVTLEGTGIADSEMDKEKTKRR